MSHTPGPWRWSCLVNEPLNTALLSDGAADLVFESSISPSDSDARLIAAAPELLEALEGLVDNTEAEANWAKAFSAIKKAKGL
jgi:hypothetical protein